MRIPLEIYQLPSWLFRGRLSRNRGSSVDCEQTQLISIGIALKNRPKIYGIGTSNLFRFLLHGHWIISWMILCGWWITYSVGCIWGIWGIWGIMCMNVLHQMTISIDLPGLHWFFPRFPIACLGWIHPSRLLRGQRWPFLQGSVVGQSNRALGPWGGQSSSSKAAILGYLYGTKWGPQDIYPLVI